MKRAITAVIGIIVILLSSCAKSADQSDNSVPEPTQVTGNSEEITGAGDEVLAGNETVTPAPTISIPAENEASEAPVITQAASAPEAPSVTISAGIEGINEEEINMNTNYVPGFVILKDWSFWIDLENWGKVCFIAASGEGEFGLNSLYMYLADKDSNILYEFPSFNGNGMFFYGIHEAAFQDVNNDGLKDLIVIADYMTGIGPDGAKEFPVAGVYFQQGQAFVNLPDLDEGINASGKNETIDMVVEYLKGEDIQLN